MNEVTVQQTTPAELIKIAVTSNADLDKLEKVMALQERWEANEARKAYNKAMSDFKSVPIEIEKDRKVGYSTSAGKVGYSHASLANVVNTISKELSKYGLSVSWKTKQENNSISVTCRISHSLGHFEETTLSANADTSGSKNSIQAIGSTITYLERYTILAATGLATSDQDDDGNSATEKINEWQVEDLKKLLKEKGLPESGLIKFMKVEKLEHIPLNQYAKAEAAIRSAKKASENK